MALAARLGYKASALWAYAAELNFKSQFDKGYSKYPAEDSAEYISKFMAPGYLLGSIGMTYTHPREDLKVLLSPVSEKMTFVTDRRLSDEGAYGVDKGDRVLAEFGALVKGTYSKKITENILFNTEVLLTSAYKSFGKVDVDWKMALDWKLNKYLNFQDNTYLPTKGSLNKISGEITLPGSDDTYYKIGYRNRTYFPLNDDKSLILGLRGDIAYGGGYGKTEDRCPPVLAAVYVGQEQHTQNLASQRDYDAHNFIEFRYSEPVFIGDGSAGKPIIAETEQGRAAGRGRSPRRGGR